MNKPFTRGFIDLCRKYNLIRPYMHIELNNIIWGFLVERNRVSTPIYDVHLSMKHI